MANRIQLRRDTAAVWTSTAPILALGEVGIETDTRRCKVGDGTTAWAGLSYAFPQELDAGVSVAAGYVPGVVAADSSYATANTTAINAALQTYQQVVVNAASVYVKTIKIPSGKTLVVNGSLIRAANTNFFCVINEHQSVLVQANQTVRASNVVTIAGASCPWSVGTQVFIANGMNSRAGVSLQTSFLGVNATGYLATISAVGASSFSYAQTGANQTASASAQDFLAIIPVKQTFAAANITVAAGVATVTETGHNKRPGRVFFLGSEDNLVAGLKGVFEVVSTTDTTWTFATTAVANPTAGSTFIYNSDHDITVCGEGFIDGNRANNLGALVAWPNRVRAICGFGACSGTKINLALRNSAQQLVQFNNCVDTDVSVRAGSGNTQVSWQFEGGGKRNVVRSVGGNSVSSEAGYPSDDFSSLLLTDWNVSSPYNSAISPYGLWYGHADVRIEARLVNALNALKIAGNPGYVYDNIVVDGVSNSVYDSQTANGVWVHDDGTGFAGAVIKTLKINDVAWRLGTYGSNAVRFESTGTCENLIVTNMNASDTVGIAVRVASGTITNLRLNEVSWVTQASRTTQRLVTMDGGTVRNLNIRDSHLTTGNGTSGGFAIDRASGSTVTTITFENCTLEGVSANTGHFLNLSGSTTVMWRGCRTGAVAPSNLGYLNAVAGVYDLRHQNCDLSIQYGYNDNAITSSGNKFAAESCRFVTNASFNVVQVAGASAWAVQVSPTAEVSGGGWIRSSGSSATYSLFGGASLRADAALIGTRIARTAGSQFFTTTASGTVVANNVLICDATNAANSFKQISDTTKAV